MLGFGGVTAIDTSVAAVTVRVVDPDAVPRVAVIVVEPGPTAVPRPILPAVLLIDPTLGDEEVQTTDPVRSCIEPSVYTPVAVYGCCNPVGRVGFAGVTPIDTSVAAATVRLVDPDTLPRVAVMVVEPEPAAVANPLEPVVLLIEAMLGAEELHATAAVRSSIESSL
jgi:hypothetical protein